MQWDLGIQGVLVLIVMSVGFGVLAHLFFWNRATIWVWPVASAAVFVAGLFISEVLFGWATQAELQPNIDGLSFDEVLLGYLFVGIPVVLVSWYLTRRSRQHGPMSA